MQGKAIHNAYMRRCFNLAQRGLGYTAPNPLVGAVIVCDEKIIGEGYHTSYGTAHAEVNAISSVEDKSLLERSVLYVNLEPCAHHGNTPPCTDAIIESRIKEIVISNVDTNPYVAGKGIEKLRAAGCSVHTGVLEEEGRELNKRFFCFHEKNRPYIILKWAQSRDGFIDIVRSVPSDPHINWITGNGAKLLVHKWRSQEQAILVGTKTAKLDNPRLNVREWYGSSPLRCIIDKGLVLNGELNVFDRTVETIVFTEKQKENEEKIIYKKIDFSKNIIPQVLEYLYERNIQSIIIEGGAYTLNSYIESNTWDEARVLTGNKIFVDGIKASQINIKPDSKYDIEEDEINIFRNKESC